MKGRKGRKDERRGGRERRRKGKEGENYLYGLRLINFRRSSKNGC